MNAVAGHQATPPYRVFISYSHEDRKKFETLRRRLEDKKHFNFTVLSDQVIGAGSPFTNAIKDMITYSHLFIPLITRSSKEKPWVHQETGYAMARNIPILPLVIKGTGMPKDMIAQLQAISITSDFKGLETHLTPAAIDMIITPCHDRPLDTVRIAEWPEERTELMASYTERVRRLARGPQAVRQRGLFSSFSIPNKDINDAAWKVREGRIPVSDSHRSLLRQERLSLESHVPSGICRLIIDPGSAAPEINDCSRVERMKVLREFLHSRAGKSVQVVISSHAAEGHITIVGDWFIAESLVPRQGGFRQTIFHWHAPTATRWVDAFDQQFADACEQQGLTPANCTAHALRELNRLISEYTAKTTKKRGKRRT